MRVFVISDLHLLLKPDPFLFNEEKECAFELLTTHILESDGRLVCAGDIFDLTGLTPCRYGLDRFFREAVPRDAIDEKLVRETSLIRSTEELLTGIAAGFPKFFACLAKLAASDRLHFIPGNHDWALSETPNQHALAQLLHVTPEAIHWAPEFTFGNFVIASHGNQYDPQNRTDNRGENIGSIMTSALYQGVMPALDMMGIDRTLVSAILAVRPEEETITGLEHFLRDTEMKRILVALTRLLAANDYFRGMGRIIGWFVNHDVPFFSWLLKAKITSDRVRGILPDDKLLREKARDGARELRAQFTRKNPALAGSIVVLGHTHQMDQSPGYVNLGTWIDHLTHLDRASIDRADRSLPFLVIDSGTEAILYDARSLRPGRALIETHVLWRTGDPAPQA